MTHALSDPPPDARLDGLRIRAVETDEDLEIYGAILVRGFGLPEFVGDVFVTLLRDLGTGPDTEARTFIGTLDGEDVATAAVFLHGDTAGVYNVSTIESARRRGIGAAITLACEDEARSRGFELATLQSSEAGYGVYKALGYEEVCKFEQFILAG